MQTHVHECSSPPPLPISIPHFDFNNGRELPSRFLLDDGNRSACIWQIGTSSGVWLTIHRVALHGQRLRVGKQYSNVLVSCVAACRRLSAATQDVIAVNLWTTIFPSTLPTAPQIWSNISSPDKRLYLATQRLGVPMNLTFSNATVYNVRPSLSATALYCLISFLKL